MTTEFTAVTYGRKRFITLSTACRTSNPFADVSHLTVGEDEDSVEPLPEGEVPLWQRLLAEHLPAQVQLVVFVGIPVEIKTLQND